MLRPWGRTVHVDMWVSLRGKPQGKGVELRPMGYGAVLRLRLLVVWRARSVGTRTHSPAKANWARAGVFTARDRKQLLSPDFRSDVLARLLFNWSKKLRRSRQVLLHMVDSGIKKQTKPMRALTHTGRWVRIKDIHSCRERDQGIMTLEVTVRALGCEGELWETGEAPTTGYKVTGLPGTRSQRCPHSSFPKSYSHLPPLPEGLLLLIASYSSFFLFTLWNPPQLTTAPPLWGFHDLLLPGVRIRVLLLSQYMALGDNGHLLPQTVSEPRKTILPVLKSTLSPI